MMTVFLGLGLLVCLAIAAVGIGVGVAVPKYRLPALIIGVLGLLLSFGIVALVITVISRMS